MNKVIGIVIGVLVLVLIIWGLSQLPAQTPTEPVDGVTETGPIKIGFVGPLTGDAANIGQGARAAVELAVKERNDTGGVNGRTLEVVYEDGKCVGVDASNAANKLINIDKVPVIIGGACSGETAAFAGAAEQAKVATLSYCSSAPNISQAGDYIFRNYPSDSFQGAFAARYAFETLGKKKAAILYVTAEWGTGIKDIFAPTFKELGGTIVAEEGYLQTSRDLRTSLTKIKSAKPDILYFVGYTEASIPGLKQAAELDLDVLILGADAWDDAKIWTEAGRAGEGAMFVVPRPATPDFAAKFKQVTGNDPAICAAQAYDAVGIISEVMEQGALTGEAIRNALYQVQNYPGVSGTISFDEKGDLAEATYVVKVVKDGKAEVVAQ